MLVVAAAPACAPGNATPAPAPALTPAQAPAAAERQFEFGARRVQVKVPTGWEALDQGNQKRFRRGEFEIVLQFLGPATPPPRDLDALFDWGLAAVGQAVGRDQRREEKSRRTVTVDGRDAVDIETWNRLDHTNPQRVFLIRDDGELLALHTVRLALADSLAAFDAIRDSLHFVSGR
jgi:hypothetical protein